MNWFVRGDITFMCVGVDMYGGLVNALSAQLILALDLLLMLVIVAELRLAVTASTAVVTIGISVGPLVWIWSARANVVRGVISIFAVTRDSITVFAVAVCVPDANSIVLDKLRNLLQIEQRWTTDASSLAISRDTLPVPRTSSASTELRDAIVIAFTVLQVQ